MGGSTVTASLPSAAGVKATEKATSIPSATLRVHRTVSAAPTTTLRVSLSPRPTAISWEGSDAMAGVWGVAAAGEQVELSSEQAKIATRQRPNARGRERHAQPAPRRNVLLSRRCNTHNTALCNLSHRCWAVPPPSHTTQASTAPAAAPRRPLGLTLPHGACHPIKLTSMVSGWGGLERYQTARWVRPASGGRLRTPKDYERTSNALPPVVGVVSRPLGPICCPVLPSVVRLRPPGNPFRVCGRG